MNDVTFISINLPDGGKITQPIAHLKELRKQLVTLNTNDAILRYIYYVVLSSYDQNIATMKLRHYTISSQEYIRLSDRISSFSI